MLLRVSLKVIFAFKDTFHAEGIFFFSLSKKEIHTFLLHVHLKMVFFLFQVIYIYISIFISGRFFFFFYI